MSPLDFNSVEGGQARLEAVAKAKESPQDLKQRLAQYRQTYINEVDSQQRTLNADANAFVARDAQQYLKDAAKSLGNSVVNLAVEGENLQRRGSNAAAAPAEKPAARPAGKPALPLDKQATLDFSTLAGLKKAVQTELAAQAGELAVWRQIEQIGGKFEKGWQNYQKTFANVPSLEGLSANLNARKVQKTALEDIKKQYATIKPTTLSRPAWEEDFRDMGVFLGRIEQHLKEGEQVLETRAALTAQQTALGTLEKSLRAAKTLTAEEFAQHLSSLQKQGQDLAGLQEQIRLGGEGAGEFDSLYATLQQQYHQPLSDRVTLLHGLLEAKKPADDKETKATPAEVEHQFRLFIGGAQSTLSAIDKRVGTLEKELAAAAKKPELWLNRDDYDAWLSRLDTELGAANEIKNGLDSWEQKSDQAAAAKDFINRHFQPALRRAQSLRDRADRERGEAIKNNEKKIINQKVAEMHGQLLKEWQGKKESEQYLSIADKLAALKPEDKEYQTLTAKQDALAKDLISFEGKVAFLLSKPDDLEKDVLAALQKLQADCRQWQNQIGGDRVLRQSRAAAATEPDQPHTYTVERRTRAFVKAGPTGGGHWEDRVEKEEKTEHYKFSQYVQFVSIHDPKHAPAPGKEGRGWIWINGGEKLPDPVKKAMSNRADLIVSEQKEQVQERSSRERREIRQQDLLTPRGREVLGADAARYFAGVDFLAKGDIRKAMAEFDAYLEQSKNFDADKRELHSGCIEDATRQVESHREFPEYLNALKLQAEGKIDEAIKQFRAFLSRVNAKFGGAMGPDQVGPENPARQKYAEQIGVAIEVIRKFNHDKLKLLDELSQDFIYLQTVDTARRSGKVNPLDFANLKGAQRELMLPYIPAQYLTPAERIRQSRQLGGLQGGEVGAIKDAIKNLRDKIEKGDPPVDFETEFASIRADLKKYTETTPGGTVWKNPDTNEVVANSPSSRLLAYFQQINSSDPAAREKGFLAIAAEFKDQEVGMRYTQKYLRQAMVARYRAFAETAEGQTVAAAVRRRLAADPATNNEITLNARELYKRWAAEQKPPLPAEPANPVVMQSFKKTIADSIFEDQYEREMRRAMTVRGEKAVTAARDLYYKNRGKGRRQWKDLPREEQLSWLSQVGDADLGGALLQGGALKEYNWSRPYEEDSARWYKPWSWQNYNEDDYNDFKAQAAEIAMQTVATLPIGWGAGAVGRAVGLGAVKLLVREGLTEAAVGALSRGGLRALMVAEKAGEKAIWTTLSSGMKARLLIHYGVGIAVEGTALAVMNSAWEGMYNGRSDLFDSLDAGKYGKAGLTLLENIAKAGLFRGVGVGQMGVSGLAGPNAKLLTRILTETGGEALSGVGGAGVEALFMLHDPKMREQLGWEWFAKSVLQNAAGSVAMRAGHSGMRLPEMGVFKGSREGTARRLTAAEIQLNGERLAARGIHSPADISNARIESNGDLVLRLKSGKDQIIKYSEIPFDRLPPEMRNHLYQTDKNNRDSLRAVLQETGLDSPLNWTAVTDDGAVISTTGRIVPIADPALLPPALREKHRLLVEERRQARLGPYRRPGRVKTDVTPTKTREVPPVTTPETSSTTKGEKATKKTAETSPTAKLESSPDAPRIAPDLPPRQLPPGEATTRRTGIRNTLKLYEQQAKLSADPQKNAAELARLDAQINAAAKAKNLSPEQYLRRLQSDEHLYRSLEALDRGETQLYGESKVIKKPVLDENGVQKKDANDQPVYEEVNLFANYQSKSAAYSREMLRGISYERLVAEGGGKIIKLGGDELVVYHAGPDGTVQKLFIDISNMGPTNDTATKIAGSKINLVDIYLHRLSEAVLAQSKARQGQLLDPVAFNAEVQRVADSLFNLDRDAGGKPLDAKEAAKRFDRLKAEWGLEGTYQEYLTDIQSMRILAEYRSDTRALDSSYKNHPERTFTEHISAEIQAISGLTIPQLQQLIAANPAEFRTAFEGRLPKSPKLKAMPVDELLQQIKSLDPAKSKPEDLMMLYAMLARMDTSGLAKIPALKPFTDRLAASRTALVGDPPHPRVEEPRLMDAKVVSIELPPDIAKALSALAETDPVRAHAILATARQFSEKSLDALKYGQRGRFAQFKITDYLELKNGQLQVKPTAPDFQRAVETARTDKKIGNVIDAEDSLRQARSQLETLQKQLNDGEITHREFLSRSTEIEVAITALREKLTIDPDTGAHGQAYYDISPTAMYLFWNGVVRPEHRVWQSVVTELGHSGVINAKYGYQAMDGIMADYFQVLQQGIAAELPANLQHFKIIRSGGGKFEVVFLDARAVAHLAEKGLTPHQLIERLASGPGQQAVNKVLQADPKKVAASQTDAAVRNSQFVFNKGTEPVAVGRLTSHVETVLDSAAIQTVFRSNPEISARGLLARARKQTAARQNSSAETLLPGEVSAMVDPNAYTFPVRKALSEIGALEAGRKTEHPYDPANDSEFQRLATDKDRESYLARKSEEVQDAILNERITSDTQSRIAEMADLLVDATIMHNSEKYLVDRHLTATGELPPDWQQRLVNRGPAQFIEGRSHLLVLKNTRSGAPDQYLIVNAKTIQRGDLMFLMPMVSMSKHKAYQEISSGLRTEIGQISKSIQDLLRAAQQDRIKQITDRVARSKEALESRVKELTEPARRRPLLENPYTRSLLEYGRKVRNDPEITRLSPAERSAAIAEKIRMESERIREEILGKQKAIAEISDMLFTARKENPKLPVAEMQTLFRQQAGSRRLQLTPSEQTQIDARIAAIAQKQDLVSRYYEKFSGSPEELFALAFGFRPTGKVELIKSDFSVNFRVNAVEDVGKIYSDVTNESFSAGTMGFNIPTSRLQDLAGLINVIRGDSSQVYDEAAVIRHEERHALNRTLLPDSMLNGVIILALGRANNLSMVRKLYQQHLQISLKRAQDEISAYQEQGINQNSIRRVLTEAGGGYDYWKTLEEKTRNSIIENIAGQKQPNESESEYAARRQKVTEEVDALLNEYRNLHNRRVGEMVAGAFEHPHPVLNVEQTANELARAGRRARQPAAEKPPRDKDVPLADEDVPLMDEDVPLIDKDVPLEDTGSLPAPEPPARPPTDSREALLQDISYEDAVKQRQEIYRQRRKAEDDDNRPEIRRLNREANIALLREELAQAIRDKAPAEEIALQRRELRDLVYRHTPEELGRQSTPTPRSQVELGPGVAVTPSFLDQMGYHGSIDAENGGILYSDGRGNGQVKKSGEQFVLGEYVHFNSARQVSRGIAEFSVYPALPPQSTGRQVLALVQLARTFFQQRPSSPGTVEFQTILPTGGSETAVQPRFVFTDQQTAREFAAFLDVQLNSSGYPPLSDPHLGRVGTGRVMLGADLFTIGGEKITHQERVQKALQEADGCGGDASCRTRVFQKWKINPADNQPLLGPESIDSSPPKDGEQQPPSAEEVLPASLPYQDHLLGEYQGPLNLVPRVSENTSGADPKYLRIMGSAVERLAGRLRNVGLPTLSEAMDFLAFERQRVGGAAMAKAGETGTRRKSWSISLISDSYKSWEAEARSMLDARGVNVEDIRDPVLKSGIESASGFVNPTKVYVVEEIIPGTGEKVILTTIGQDVVGRLFWLHTSGENTAKVMKYVEELYQRTQKADLPQAELIATVAEIQWWISHAMPYVRGSAAISDALSKALLLQHGIRPGRWKVGIMPDIKAFHTPREQYIREYASYFEGGTPPPATPQPEVTPARTLATETPSPVQSPKELLLGLREQIIGDLRQGSTENLSEYLRKIDSAVEKSLPPEADLQAIQTAIDSYNDFQRLLADFKSAPEVRNLLEAVTKKKNQLIMRSGGLEVERAWRILLAENPVFETLRVRQGQVSQDNVLAHTGGFFSPGWGAGIDIMPTSREHYQRLMETRPTSVQMVADRLGISREAMTPELLRAFIILHELGHAGDYLSMGKEAAKSWSARSNEEKAALPVPNQNPATLLNAIKAGELSGMLQTISDPGTRRVAEKAAQGDQPSIELLVSLQEKAYKATASERIADDFATDFIKRHAAEMGLDLRPAVAAPRDMLLSGFSETPPPNIPKDSPGWIDTGGQIFYNPRALSSALAPGHTVVASEPGQGIRIRTPDNRIVGLGEYRRSVKGTPHEATPHALLEKMREIKNHESMHRVTTMLTDPVSFFAARDQQNALPEGKVELTDVQGKPLPLTRDNVDEFISRVADGTQPITPGQRALLQKAIAVELRAKGIKNFTFEAVRQADTRLLSTNPREAFRRVEVAAMPNPAMAPDVARTAPMEVQRARNRQETAEIMSQLPITFDLIIGNSMAEGARIAYLDRDRAMATIVSRDTRINFGEMPLRLLQGEIARANQWKQQLQEYYLALAQYREAAAVGRSWNRLDRPTPIAEVPRPLPVKLIGDLHGQYVAYVDNLRAAGLIDQNGHYVGGAQVTVFHGDILADRGTGSFEILRNLRTLRQQALEAGGDVVVLAGNHEDMAISFLSGENIAAANVDGLSMGIHNEQGAGLVEFIKVFSTRDGHEKVTNLFEAIQLYHGDTKAMQRDVLMNMRNTNEGRQILEDICSLRLLDQIDDTLVLHTELTPKIVQMLSSGDSIGNTIDNINRIYQQGLRHLLLGEGTRPEAYNLVRDTFLDVGNRAYYSKKYRPGDLGRLHELGINMVSSGHSNSDASGGRNIFPTPDKITLIGVDHSYAKSGHGKNNQYYSVAAIGSDGQVHNYQK